jgi:glycosyltransferase involved in cell wall biosynthesis
VAVIVEAFSQMPDRELIVIGDGPDRSRIEAAAGPNVRVLGYRPIEDLRDHLQRASAFVFAAEEDFGILPVEAQACGTPVIAYGKAGALETVIDGETGIFFYEQTPASIIAAVDRFEGSIGGFNPDRLRQNALRFSRERFKIALGEFVEMKWQDFNTDRRPAR